MSIFDNNTDKYSEIFKALSNPNRLKIFMRLASCCTPVGKSCDNNRISAYVGELGDELDIAPSTVSHHIKELRRAGLIHMKRRGQNMDCWIEPDTLRELSSFFSCLNQQEQEVLNAG
jgi:ArsR family transcriptional regulator